VDFVRAADTVDIGGWAYLLSEHQSGADVASNRNLLCGREQQSEVLSPEPALFLPRHASIPAYEMVAMTLKDRSCLAIRVPLFIALILGFTSTATAEWKEKVLYSFQGLPDGSLPVGAVVFDTAGNLYGATTEGGSSSCASVAQCGTVYQLAPPVKQGDPWTETVLHVFKGNTSNDGASPAGGLVIDAAGNLYGTTAYGGTGNCVVLGILMGCGTVFELSPPQRKGGQWTEKVLYSFPTPKQGFLPQGDLVFDGAGNLYGATQFGGGYGTTCNAFYKYCGAVFELSAPKIKGGKWTEKALHGFKSGTDGANPNGGLVLDSEGRVYGTTFGGGNETGECGAGGCGTAFKLNPPAQKGGAWTEEMLYRFNVQDGATPAAGVIFGGNGDLYGTAYAGGTNGNGAVFDLAPPKGSRGPWKETVLHRFSGGNDGENPTASLILDSTGNLYGTTEYGNIFSGSVFRMKPPNGTGGSWSFGLLYGFTGSPDGAHPAAKLIFDRNGNLYSATQGGGTGTSCSGYCGTMSEISP
jgi:hypothetical protein